MNSSIIITFRLSADHANTLLSEVENLSEQHGLKVTPSAYVKAKLIKQLDKQTSKVIHKVKNEKPDEPQTLEGIVSNW